MGPPPCSGRRGPRPAAPRRGAAATGAGILAGEEERGLLDLLLANPVSRARVVWEKSLVLVLSLLATIYPAWKAARTDPVVALKAD